MMKKNMHTMIPLAICIGAGSLMYSYMKMHPIKAKAIKSDVKNMMKDLS